MKFYSIVGTRPNLVKEFLINAEATKRGFQEIIVHTGQHYDHDLSGVFFQDFALPNPHHFLAVQNSDNISFTAGAMQRLAQLFREDRPDFVLAYGDVNSTLSAAVAASKLRIPFAHIEGGIRSSDRYNPEEINRRVSDTLAEVNYCCTDNHVLNLKAEGHDARNIVMSGDLMKDVLMYTLSRLKVPLVRGDYMVLTLHRQENVTSRCRLEAIVDGLIRSGKRIVFPAHPHTRKQLESFGLIKKLARSNIELMSPLGYVDFVKLLAGADKVLTDSGGVRREAYLLKKPCVVLIELSWFPEISRAGWKVLTGPDPERIASLINAFEPTGPHCELFGDGRAHLKILDDLEQRFGGVPHAN
jgi:UDP-N-acetylglucosamine 2-epimerase (non-hydrolysing)